MSKTITIRPVMALFAAALFLGVGFGAGSLAGRIHLAACQKRLSSLEAEKAVTHKDDTVFQRGEAQREFERNLYKPRAPADAPPAPAASPANQEAPK